ncbi:response regulator [Baaleninema sp.]|uniref:response regulator n=1 Tax=Baaleninema sp. TaxID=3101197 RepID=UPI003D0360BB
MVSHLPGIATLARSFSEIQQHEKTGKLLLNGRGERWQYYFIDGQLLYTIGGRHRVRRWNRALAKHCPHWRLDLRSISPTGLWEYQLLHRALRREELNLAQVRGIVASVTREVLFSSLDSSELSVRWIPVSRPETPLPLGLRLTTSEFDALFKDAINLWQQWQGMGLSYINPDDAPRWQAQAQKVQAQLSQSSLSVRQLLGGQYSLWDIAQKRKRSLAYLTRTLHHFVEAGTLEFRALPDLPSPFEQMQLVEAAVTGERSAIACIDDSPIVGERLKQILEPAGYRVLNIQHPLQEMATLLSEQPELIFLDLTMPVIHGCDLCAFLRKTSVFQATPIVILTSSDGALDRVRANLSGASEFLSKPPNPKAVLEVVRKHLTRSRPFAMTSYHASDLVDV